MSQSKVAEALGVVRQTVGAWVVKKGCPRNDDGSYSLPDVVDWLVNEAKNSGGEPSSCPSPEADFWLTEYRKERALKAKIEREEYEKTLLKRDEVAANEVKQVMAVKTALMIQLDRLPPILIGKTRGEVREILEAEYFEIMRQFGRNGRYSG